MRSTRFDASESVVWRGVFSLLVLVVAGRISLSGETDEANAPPIGADLPQATGRFYDAFSGRLLGQAVGLQELLRFTLVERVLAGRLPDA
jgi:hypothetical protein